MVNTKKGESLFAESVEFFTAAETPIEWTDQPHLSHPVRRPDNADYFWEFYSKHNMEITANKFLYGGIIKGALRRIWHLLH